MDNSKNSNTKVKNGKKTKKGKNKLDKNDIGAPTDFKYIRGCNKHVQEILELAGVTNKHLQSIETRTVIDHFIEVHCNGLNDDVEKSVLVPGMPKALNSKKTPFKRPTAQPPPPPTQHNINQTWHKPPPLPLAPPMRPSKAPVPSGPSAGPPPPPPPIGLLMNPVPLPLPKVTGSKDLPTIEAGADDFLKQIERGVTLKSLTMIQENPASAKPELSGRDALMDAIRNGRKLKTVVKRQNSNKKSGIKRQSMLLAEALRNALKSIACAKHSASSSDEDKSDTNSFIDDD